MDAKSKRYYYINVKTKKTQWKCPEEFKGDLPVITLRLAYISDNSPVCYTEFFSFPDSLFVSLPTNRKHKAKRNQKKKRKRNRKKKRKRNRKHKAKRQTQRVTGRHGWTRKVHLCI